MQVEAVSHDRGGRARGQVTQRGVIGARFPSPPRAEAVEHRADAVEQRVARRDLGVGDVAPRERRA